MEYLTGKELILDHV